MARARKLTQIQKHTKNPHFWVTGPENEGVGDECTGMLGPLCGLWVERWKFSGQVTSCNSAKPFPPLFFFFFSFPHAYRPWSSLLLWMEKDQHTISPGSGQEVKEAMYISASRCYCGVTVDRKEYTCRTPSQQTGCSMGERKSNTRMLVTIREGGLIMRGEEEGVVGIDENDGSRWVNG